LRAAKTNSVGLGFISTPAPAESIFTLHVSILREDAAMDTKSASPGWAVIKLPVGGNV